jgi:hypothetical protein
MMQITTSYLYVLFPEALVGNAIEVPNVLVSEVNDAKNPMLIWCCTVNGNEP